jgi:hypothetical protein
MEVVMGVSAGRGWRRLGRPVAASDEGEKAAEVEQEEDILMLPKCFFLLAEANCVSCWADQYEKPAILRAIGNLFRGISTVRSASVFGSTGYNSYSLVI